jgi:hypothetical protein
VFEIFRAPARPTFANSGKSRQKRQKEPPVPSLQDALWGVQVETACRTFTENFLFRFVIESSLLLHRCR